MNKEVVCGCGRQVDTQTAVENHAVAILCHCGQTYVLDDKDGEYKPFIKLGVKHAK